VSGSVKCEGQCVCVKCEGLCVCVKCEGLCVCYLSSANPLLWSLYMGLACSRLLEIYEYTDRKVTNDWHLFTAPKYSCSSDESLRPQQDCRLTVNCYCNSDCAGLHIYVMSAGNWRHLAGHTVPCSQYGVPHF